MNKSKLNKDNIAIVRAIKNGDKLTQNKLIPNLFNTVEKSLKKIVRCSSYDAKEATHEAFQSIYEKVVDGHLKDDTSLFSYFLVAAKNHYLNEMKTQARFSNDLENSNFDEKVSKTIETAFIEAEERRLRKYILERSISKMHNPANKKFMKHLIEFPDIFSEEGAKMMNTTQGAYRARKVRAIEDLQKIIPTVKEQVYGHK